MSTPFDAQWSDACFAVSRTNGVALCQGGKGALVRSLAEKGAGRIGDRVIAAIILDRHRVGRPHSGEQRGDIDRIGEGRARDRVVMPALLGGVGAGLKGGDTGLQGEEIRRRRVYGRRQLELQLGNSARHGERGAGAIGHRKGAVIVDHGEIRDAAIEDMDGIAADDIR